MTLKRFCYLVLRRFLYLYRKMASQTRIKQYLRTHHVHKLHLGSGRTQIQGWLCTDIVPYTQKIVFLDATKTFPFPDASFDFIYSEHMIEHLTQLQGINMLKECYRVLKPGGYLRVATPNLDVILKLYTEQNDGFGADYIRWSMDRFAIDERDMFGYDPVIVLNYFNHMWGHQFLYNQEYMTKVLQKVKFKNVAFPLMHQSDIPDLNNIENHHQVVNSDEMITFESLIVEAQKL